MMAVTYGCTPAPLGMILLLAAGGGSEYRVCQPADAEDSAPRARLFINPRFDRARCVPDGRVNRGNSRSLTGRLTSRQTWAQEGRQAAPVFQTIF
jgi:hypothetical protein